MRSRSLNRFASYTFSLTTPAPLLNPKATLHCKKSRQPCHFVVGVQRTSCYLCPPPSLHSLTARASPFHKQKITTLIFYLFHSGSGLFYLFGLSRFAHTQPPTTHPLNTVDDIFYLRSTQIFKCNQRENKKNAHKDNSKKISQ